MLTLRKGQLMCAGDPFHADNRMGLTGTLHRISAIRDRDGSVIGITYRIGRHMPGVGKLMWDILASLGSRPKDSEQGDVMTHSLLLLGHPGVGKTTLLRDVTGLLAERFKKRVVVVDTSNEIGGDGTVPHSCIGRARRMPVVHKSRQHEILQEAVQNHNPEVIVVDEIGSPAEAAAVRGIAQRGVVMLGTAHGTDLSSLMANPDLNSLIGGIHQVTLSDAEAKLSNGGSKTRTERKGLPAFSCLVEVLDHNKWRVHLNVAASVDALLANKHPTTQLRMHKEGKLIVRFETPSPPTPAGVLSQAAEPWLVSLFHTAKSMPSVTA